MGNVSSQIQAYFREATNMNSQTFAMRNAFITLSEICIWIADHIP
ncbi:hypothetical protein [Methanobacterium sp. SMA-27]|nr:hypothetical protein [Methanobacterium sp. SMA-27]